MTADTPHWIELQGSVNVRDVAGAARSPGPALRPGVLIRSAHLLHLTDADVRYLVGTLGVRRVVDLRTDVEVGRGGPGPLHAEPDVVIHHLSLYPDTNRVADEVTELVDPVLPWQGEAFATERGPVVESYLRYLHRRPDSIVAALRAIAEPEGATLVHCAAGKDRTGVVVALALAVAGLPVDDIAADYAATQSQIDKIVDHLARSELYAADVAAPGQIPAAEAAVMRAVLQAVEEDLGGVLGWLGRHGWTDADTARLRDRLLAP